MMPDPFTAQPKDTIFTFFNHVFNISLVERLMAAEVIKPASKVLPLDLVTAAGRLDSYIFEQDSDGCWKMTQAEDGGTVGVKMDHVQALSEDRKAEPVLLAELPPVDAASGSDLVLIDGLHRTVRHIIDGDETINTLLISNPADLCRFHYVKEGGRARDALGRPADADKIQIKYYWAGQ